MKNYKFSLSPAQELNLANKGLTYQNGKAVFNKETETELKNTIKKALAKKETIFSDNKTFQKCFLRGCFLLLVLAYF